MPSAEIRVTDKGPVIRVYTQWNEKELIKSVPGVRWNAVDTAWDLPVTWASCVTLRGVFSNRLEVGPKLNEWARQEKLNRINPALKLRLQTEPDRPYDIPLYPFQQVGMEFLDAAGDALLADDMGTGKTITTLAALSRVPNGLPALVICPNSVKTTWEREANTWLKKFELEATPYVITGTPKVKERLLAQAQADPTALVIINIESVRLYSRLAPYGSVRLRACRECSSTGDAGLRASLCEVHPKTLNGFPFNTVIVDEAHRIKDPQAKQTRAVWAVCHQPSVRRRWALTGTPIANDPSDLWSIMHAVAPTDFPNGSRSKFIDRYCLQTWAPYGGLTVIGISPEHREEFFKILDPRFRRMPKELVLPQLPSKIRQIRYVEMTPKQKTAYDQMERDYITVLGGEHILAAPTQLAVQVRLMQLASSYCTVETPDPDKPAETIVTPVDPSPKVDELIAILDDLGDKPLVVAAMSRKLIELAAKRLDKLKIPYGLITGKQTTFERDDAKEAFQNVRIRVLLFTVQAGGTGITLTRADTIVFLQRSWSMVDVMQSEDRVHRIGSERHEAITIIDVVTRDTVEDRQQIPRLYDKLNRLEEIRRDKELLAARGVETADLDDEYTRIINSHIGA